MEKHLHAAAQEFATVAHVGDFILLYLDPGAGSLIIQGLIALVAGTAVTARLYWRQVKRFFLGLGGQPERRDGDEAPQPPVDD